MTLGEQLRKARLERQRTVADVTREVKISGWIVEALEADELLERMSLVYVRGFLSTYAKYLRLDPAPLLAQLAPPQPVEEPAAAATLPPPAPAPQAMRVKLPAMRLPAVKLPTVKLPDMKLPEFKIPQVTLPSIKIAWPVVRRVALGAAALVLVIGIGRAKPWRHLPPLPKWQVTAKAPKPKTIAKAAAPKPAAAAPKPAAKKPEPPKTAAAAPAVPVPSAPRLASIAPIAEAPKPPALPALDLLAAEPLELDLTTRRATWVRVRADGKLMTQRRLQRGAKERWSANKVFEIIVANPSDVDLTLNGQAISPFAIAHKGRLLITHRGVSALTED